ncbi:sulfur oxidation c-type cytochrome SoxA [Loktanella sp. IMCC34160]|uniref:sulfur oxidation c-type cytochrome SoxA n=1 Tax=Loktanella sp. IMCC34160 TaxID=2510646 RepID=UPI00101DD50C|nr:sulfur oxidation c-type cytochrome SoxA [Loktanella sp. IMCC34160]RYG89373.1 sulfur oxidation c-type cytochrome SoxA [Loktanella sp. IMCC34160]
MKKTMLRGAIAAAAMIVGAQGALAQDADSLTINGEIDIVTEAPAAAHLDGALRTVYSGWRFRSDETQAMEMDDFDNPGMLAVEDAMVAWNTAEGTEGKSCADCHGDAAESMTNVRAVYPRWNEEAGELRNLQMQIDACRTEQMGAEAWGLDKTPMLNMEALISSVGRGTIVNVAIDGPVADMWEQGRELYYTRTGQLELSCANCHEDNYGNYIRADHLSQGQINGFPTYRLKNAKLNGVQGRFRGCVRDTRAETYAVGSPEFMALELYVASRGNGLAVEGPSVRN